MTEPRDTMVRRWSRPRMSLRLTMAAILVIGVGLGHLITKARRQAETVAMIRGLGGEVLYDWEHWLGESRKYPGPKWLTDSIGPDYNHDVTSIDLSEPKGGIDDSWADRLAELRQLQVLQPGRSPSITSAGLAKLSGLDRLKVLGLSGTGVVGGDFARLRRMTDLTQFHAVEIPTVDADLENLSGLTNLKGLVFQGDRLTDAGLAHLRPLKKLASLQITSNGPMQITTAGLAQLSSMDKLWQLLLVNSKIESLEPIRGLRSMRVLVLPNARLDDAGLAPIANFAKLEGLNLRGEDQRFGDAGLAHLAGLKSLDRLFLEDAKIGDAGLACVAGLANLELLSLDGTRITDAGLEQLAGLSRLKTLSLRRTAITDAGLARLARFAALAEVKLEGTKATPAGIEAFRAMRPGADIR